MRLCRQLWLMLWKDWVLLRRNYIWTIFEILIPIILTYPVLFFFMRGIETFKVPAIVYGSFNIRGDSYDLNLTRGSEIVHSDVCDKNIYLGYTTSESSLRKEAAILMANMTNRYRSGVEILQMEFMKDEKTLLKTLKKEKRDTSLCRLNKYIGGVVFDKIDIGKNVLEYKILTRSRRRSEKWSLNWKWERPMKTRDDERDPFPTKPPYLHSNFLTLQYAIETSFVELATKTDLTNVSLTLQSFPRAASVYSTLDTIFNVLPVFWPVSVCLTILHLAREISSEKESVKPFLSAMGLSTNIFYASHVIFGFLKFLIIFSICTVPILIGLELVSPTLFLFVVFLHGLGALVFGALIASMFKSTMTTMKCLLLLWLVSALYAKYKSPYLDQFHLCFLHSINLNGAFCLAFDIMKDHLLRGKSLGWINIFDDSLYQFPIGAAIFMQIFDIFWMSALTLAIDHLRSSIEPRGYCRKKKYVDPDPSVENVNTARSESQKSTSSMQLLDTCAETDGARDSAEPGIEVNNLVKIWASTGERAIAGLSLRAVKGQVTVLLGHNGAGKSTTFASIAGIIKPTSGNISICGHDVASELGKCRKKIGLCPQYNPLFDKLTVEEHLWLIYGLKNAPSSMFKEEKEELLEQLKLEDKRSELSMNLSGGMKRKLCVCMALIGQSEVVLLDEPTAGMDPGARKDVQAILEKEKWNRTILLTTHYMDEAEVLGDWIMIMSAGKMVASGTNKYLKQRFGTGYVLTIVINHKTGQKDVGLALERICQTFVSKAKKGEQQGQQIEVTLPEKEKNHFVDLFRALEALQLKNYSSEYLEQIPAEVLEVMQKYNTEMTTFGLSLNTLEQVFLRVVHLAQKKENRAKAGKNSTIQETAEISAPLSESNQNLLESQLVGPEKRGFGRVLAQYLSIFKKKLLYTWRNLERFIIQIVVPIAVLFAATKFDASRFGTTKDSSLSLALDSFGPSRVVIHGANPSNQLAKNFEHVLEKGVKENDFKIERYPDTKSLLNISTDLAGLVPQPGFGIGFAKNGTFTAYFNHFALHSVPTIVSAISRSRIPNGEGTVAASVYVYVSDQDGSSKSPLANIESLFLNTVLMIVLIIVVALVTSAFSMFLVEERVSKFAHQQSLTGISPLVFWSASLFFDFVIYSVICAIFFGVIHHFHWMHGQYGLLVNIFLMYFFACVPFIYSLSFLFSSPTKAGVLLLLWQIFAPLIAIFAVVFGTQMLGLTSMKYQMFFQHFFCFIFPSFAFAMSLKDVGERGGFTSFEEFMRWNKLGGNIFFLALFSVISLVLFFTLQFKQVRRALQGALCNSRKSVYQAVSGDSNSNDLPVCSLVEKEKDLVINGNTDDHALVVKNLTKTFGSFKAVNNLCMAVEQKECFGLLGQNGAGKTTTFNILTGQAFPTEGEATIGGRDVAEQIAIGYCPQFDALMNDFTGRETLEILAQMHGFNDYKKKTVSVLKSVGMVENADKLVKYYSGGQKRKISVGIALLAPTHIIILDEPTAGIDPKARRDIWEVLLRVRDNTNSALLLTSHSMDECEALCTRIAVLNKGSLIAIGTSQDLKSLYGNNYTMTLTLKNENSREKIVEKVKEHFQDSSLKNAQNKSLTMKWRIKKEAGDKWSEKFKEVEEFARDPDIEDFCFTQTSLEDTFLRLSGLESAESAP